MKTIDNEPRNSRSLTALCELGRDVARPPNKAELDEGLNALCTRIAGGRVRRRAMVRWSLAAMAVLVSTLIFLQVAEFSRNGMSARETALDYEIEGGSVLEGGYLRESDHRGIQLAFNEGTRFDLLPGTRGRLRSVDNDGARMAIENGTASFQVTQSKARRWLVEAGPFLVTVKGTVFTVSWDPSIERFELRLREGRVVVTGPVSGGDLSLRSGQRLVVSLAKSETLITEDQSEDARCAPSANPAPSVVASAVSLASTAVDRVIESNLAQATVPSSVPKLEGKRRWADELASGHWDRILEEVDRNGVEPTLNGASSEDLFALADAARYQRRAELARAALLAQRRRFPDSPRALDATFLLGRVEESRRNGMARAITWYDEYLARAPTGAYAAEALGRKMTITREIHGPTQARPIAEEYLRRFPRGSYAGSARALIRIH